MRGGIDVGRETPAKWRRRNRSGRREDPPVLDLTSLIVVAGIFLGLAVGNAALFGDPV
jgi:hypothetical protein